MKVVDFDFIEEGAEKGAPKYMEWFCIWVNGYTYMAISRNS